MKNIQVIIILIITIFLLSCNFSPDSSNEFSDELIKYENLFDDLKTFLAEENGELWGYQLYGPILLVNPENNFIIANEPDNKDVLTKNGNIFTGYLPKEIIIANTAIEWNGKMWTMLMLPLPENEGEQFSIIIHELFHRIQSKIGFKDFQQGPCNHLDKMNGRIYLTLELEALKKALSANSNNAQNEHIKNAIYFRMYRYNLFPESKENENALEYNEGLAEYTGSILSNWSDDELRKHYINTIDELYENKTFVRSFAYRTTPVYGYFLQQKNKYWNKEIISGTNLTDYFVEQFKIPLVNDLEKTIISVYDEYNYQEILSFETEREQKQKELFAMLETKFLVDPVLILTFQQMNIGFNPGELIPFKDMGTIYPNIRVTDNWGILEVEEYALMGKEWREIIVSEPIEISDTLITGEGWKLELNKDWELTKVEENYTLEKK